MSIGCFTIFDTKWLGTNQEPQMIEEWKLHLLKCRRIAFQDLQPFSLNHEPNMSRGALDNMLQMSAVQLKVPLNVACKVVDNVCIVLLGWVEIEMARNPLPYNFTNTLSFKVLDQLENLNPVWKCVEIELLSISCLNNLKRLSPIICLHIKDLLHCPKHDFDKFG